MALIAVTTYITEENGRLPLAERALRSLSQTVDTKQHRVVISDNASFGPGRDLVSFFSLLMDAQVIWSPENVGTARAVNKVIKMRASSEIVIKVDSDMVFHQPGWADDIEIAMSKDTSIGIMGPKLKVLEDNPVHSNSFYRTTLRLLVHRPGEKWYVAEYAQHIPGACSAMSPALLDKIGYMWQPGLYGWDDVLTNTRARFAGFKCAFLHGIDVDHIDPGSSDYSEWKRKYAGAMQGEVGQVIEQYKRKQRSLYCEAE
jgi:GT2 family glycosyltransferase